ncbi:MAG: 2-C-methyl-D-erythritol 4-phosphate cytidylyltransferase [bacterium]
MTADRPSATDPGPRAAWGLIVAAGRGSRFGGPKQFGRAGGRPLLWYSLSAFDRCSEVAGWTVVTLPERVGAVRRLCLRAGFRRLRAVVAGGATRTESVRLGLETLPERGRVAVHDAARPLLVPAMIAAGLRLCGSLPVTYAVPVADSLKRVAAGRVVASVDRDGLWAVQTPQFFPLPLLRRAHRSADGLAATDDCALVERLGIRPRVLVPPGPNLKVTWPEDLALVRRLL